MTEKEQKYDELLKKAAALVAGETDVIANMANLAALIHSSMGFWWTGFYLVKQSSDGVRQLVLGPFQGPVACTRIPFGRGVCGTAWQNGSTVIVPDVEQFPGHIACSSQSRSEIVVPVMANGEVAAVLDIDSQYLNTFDAVDKQYLEQLAELVTLSPQ